MLINFKYIEIQAYLNLDTYFAYCKNFFFQETHSSICFHLKWQQKQVCPGTHQPTSKLN